MTKNNLGLTNPPSAQWIGPNDSEVMPTAGIKVESLSDEELVSSVRLTFSPLRTSLGGVYICRGVISTPAVAGGVVVVSKSSTVTVQSECVYLSRQMDYLQL